MARGLVGSPHGSKIRLEPPYFPWNCEHRPARNPGSMPVVGADDVYVGYADVYRIIRSYGVFRA